MSEIRDAIGMWEDIGRLYADAADPERDPRWTVLPVCATSDTFTIVRIPKEKS